MTVFGPQAGAPLGSDGSGSSCHDSVRVDARVLDARTARAGQVSWSSSIANSSSAIDTYTSSPEVAEARRSNCKVQLSPHTYAKRQTPRQSLVVLAESVRGHPAANQSQCMMRIARGRPGLSRLGTSCGCGVCKSFRRVQCTRHELAKRWRRPAWSMQARHNASAAALAERQRPGGGACTIGRRGPQRARGR